MSCQGHVVRRALNDSSELNYNDVVIKQIKPTRVVATSDISSDRAGWLQCKAGDIVVVLSKK